MQPTKRNAVYAGHLIYVTTTASGGAKLFIDDEYTDSTNDLYAAEDVPALIGFFGDTHSYLEFNMCSATAMAVKEQVRGVYCVYCGKPVRLSVGLIRREASIRNEPAQQQQLQSRVFPARCRSCRAESIYTLDQIVNLRII
jgi:hypothetical protein